MNDDHATPIGRGERSRGEPGRRRTKRGIVLGFSAFEKISAVEGYVVSREMRQAIMEASADDLSPVERTELIVARFGKA